MSRGIVKLQVPESPESSLTTKEKIVLLRSSKLHGCVFPPWQAAPSSDEFVGAYLDNTNFRLSPEQLECLDEWKRPTLDGVSLSAWKAIDVDLVQDITTDCSVVASLCAENARCRKNGLETRSIFNGSIYPQYEVPYNSKFILKLHFNGCWRKVMVDDRLPCTSRASRVLHVLDRNDPKNLLPALVEKAYLKVRGGYDFPGSNSGTDLWTLTGWIPEQLFLQSEDVVPQQFWKRVFSAFQYGDVMITLGTHNLTQEEEEALGLAGQHAYAVIDLRERDDRQMLLIKNPWSKGGTWTGYIDHSNPSTRSQPEQPEELAPGYFWMDLYNVIQYFHTVYLNWNPGLFNYRRDTHFAWSFANNSQSFSLTKNPQFLLQSNKEGPVFLVLTRHFQDSDIQIDPAPAQNNRATSGYLSLCAFKAQYRLVVTQRPCHRSNYVDAPNVLLRFNLIPNQTYTILVSEQQLARQETNFTLSAFTLNPLTTFCAAPERYSGSVSIEGAWTEASARGHMGREGYDRNPQFSFTIEEESDVELLIESNNNDFSVHVKLVWAGGKRIQLPINTKDIYCDSGDYTKGCAQADILKILPGTYTIVCSTYESGQVGGFSLRISSMTSKCALKPIAHEHAGMVVQQLPMAIFSQSVDRLLAPLEVTRNTRLRFIVQACTSRSATSLSPIKLSIEFGQGPNKTTLLTSGEFILQKQIRTSDLDINPKMAAQPGPGVWLVIERAGGCCAAGYEKLQVEVLSDISGVRVGPWGKESDVPIEQLRQQLKESSIRSR